MSVLLILGAGGHGKVVGEAAAAMGRWERLVFLDDRFPVCSRVLGWDVLGRLDDADAWGAGSVGLDGFGAPPEAVVAIGGNETRTRLLRALAARGFALPSVIHPRACVSPSAEIGAGTVILAQATVNAQARLGLGCIVNTGAAIDHDCRLGDGVHVSPGAHIAGEVRIDRHAWIGIGANVIEASWGALVDGLTFGLRRQHQSRAGDAAE